MVIRYELKGLSTHTSVLELGYADEWASSDPGDAADESRQQMQHAPAGADVAGSSYTLMPHRPGCAHLIMP